MIAVRAAGARIMPAVAGVYHHQRAAGIDRPFDRGQIDRPRAVGQGQAHDIRRGQAAIGDFMAQPQHQDRQRQHKGGQDRPDRRKAPHPARAGNRLLHMWRSDHSAVICPAGAVPLRPDPLRPVPPLRALGQALRQCNRHI